MKKKIATENRCNPFIFKDFQKEILFQWPPEMSDFSNFSCICQIFVVTLQRFCEIT